MSASESDATVLVVDDESNVADSLSLRIGRRYDVRTAYGGEEAL
jgi:DNA-binding NtrC family response regulator